MSPLHVKVGGVWKQAASVHTKVGGVWKTAADMPVRVGGAWKTNILGVPNDFEHIQTITVGAGGAASVTFSSIPQTYKHLQIRGVVIVSGSDTNFRSVFNGDTANNYAYHYIFGNGASAASGGGTANPRNYHGYVSSAGYPFAFVIDALDYTNTSKNTTTRTLNGLDANGSGYVMLDSSLWLSTAAVTSLTFNLDNVGSTIAQHSTIALYGVKG